MKKKKVELLAPAGSPEGFYGAIHAGADAVYLGGANYSARAYANNFTIDELIDAVQYAHMENRKVYLTVNTLVKEQELGGLYDYLLPLYEAGLDGAIIQDMGVFVYIRGCFPRLDLHVSTQMTLTGKYGAGMLKEMGASRIVPARELSLEEIKEIKLVSGLEIETFIHGAMCYCYSGQCLFSSILGGRSGNRGRCAQPCRLPYRLDLRGKITDTCYPLSLKDMCTIEHIPELIAAGIDSFKIEGRMKKPEYAAGVTAIYRKYIDRYYEAPEKPFVVEEDDLRMLSSLYIRMEPQNGYYLKRNGADMVTLHSPSYSSGGDSFLGEIRTRSLFQKKRKKIDIYGDFRIGEPAQVTFVCGEFSATVSGRTVQEAKSAPITEEVIKKQLDKLGETFWEAEHIMINLDDNAFYSLKEINELRRQAAKDLTEECSKTKAVLSNMDIRPKYSAERVCEQNTDTALHGMAVVISTQEQLLAWRDLQHTSTLPHRIPGHGAPRHSMPWYRICLDGDLYVKNRVERFREAAEECSHIAPVFLVLPHILRKDDRAYLKETLDILSLPQVAGCMVRSLEGYAYLRESGYPGVISADAGIYLWNRESIKFWQDRLSSACLPLELTQREQQDLLKCVRPGHRLFEKMIYGRIPLMITANCVAKTIGGCQNCDTGAGNACLTDRYRKEFPVVLNCAHCMNILYNSVPLSLHNEFMKWKDKAGLRLDFTVENRKETYDILEFYTALWRGEKDRDVPLQEYTTGHEKRGVL